MEWGSRSRKIPFPKVLERVSFQLSQQKSQFKIFMQTPLENPLMIIESFSRRFQVGEKKKRGCRVWLKGNFGLDGGKGWGNIKDVMLR